MKQIVLLKINYFIAGLTADESPKMLKNNTATSPDDGRIDSALLDVSVILNIHREALYLRPTLLSLNACARYAADKGLQIELVAVFDQSDNDTRVVFATTDLDAFTNVKTIDVDFGSLGLARNAGIDSAEGEYIWTSDADDLVSSNAIFSLFSIAASRSQERLVLFCEYCIGFGERYFIGRYENSTLLCAADFAFAHCYVSRIFIRRSVFETMRYRDLKLSKGFAYEDWDLNARLFAEGFRFEVARETAFFYRQRGDSLLQKAERYSSRLIPHSRLFEPDFFSSAMAQKRAENRNWHRFLKERRKLQYLDHKTELFSSPTLRQAVIEAARIDPEVGPLPLERASSYCPLPMETDHWGFALETAFRMLGNRKFSDVVLLPWLLPGGAEKHILEAMDALWTAGRATRILILTGERVNTVGWQERLHGECVFLDVFNTFFNLDDGARDELTARILLSTTTGGARLHFKPSEFAHRLIERYGVVLSSHLEIISYRFCDREFYWHMEHLRDQYGIQFLRRSLGFLQAVLYDSSAVMQRDIRVLPPLKNKARVVYARCSLPPERPPCSDTPRFRLLWASRISAQKRPDLITPLATALFRRAPHITIDVYGAIDEGFSVGDFVRGPNLQYKGGFEHFYDLPLQDYDAILYTSDYDGLPNIILEAMASGLTVIAPDVGGVSEAVSSETGYLISITPKANDLTASYVDAVLSIYSDWPRALQKRVAARALLESRHCDETFIQSLSIALGLPGPDRSLVRCNSGQAASSTGAGHRGLAVQEAHPQQDRSDRSRTE